MSLRAGYIHPTGEKRHEGSAQGWGQGLPGPRVRPGLSSAPPGSLGWVQAWTERAGLHASKHEELAELAGQPFQGVWEGRAPPLQASRHPAWGHTSVRCAVLT